MSDSNSQKRGAGKLWFVLLALGLAIAIFLATRGGDNGGNDGDDSGDVGEVAGLDERLELTRTALAATENLEMLEADGSWSVLFDQTPDDASVAINLAINRVLRVDQLSAQATNASFDDAKKKAARVQLPDAIAGAREAIDAFGSIAEGPVMPLWLQARIDLHEASLLPGSMTRSLRRKVYEQLSESINGELGKEPTAIILGGTLIQVVEQMEDPIDGLPEGVLTEAAETIGNLSNQHPDNLFFALRAARLHIAAQNAQAADYVRRASELAKSIEPSLRRETQAIGVTPDELVAQISDAIESGDWLQAENRMLLWFNVLNSTEIVKTDRRRATPHPLDRLSFDSLRRLSAEVVQSSPLAQGSGEITFESTSIEGAGETVLVQSVDFDLDLDPDLVTATSKNELMLWANEGSGNWSAAGSLQLDIQPTGIIVADLFLVDSSDPDRLRADRKTTEGEQPDYAASVRHNTMLNLIAFGAEGVRIIRVDGRSTANSESRIQLVESETGLESVSGVNAAVAGDLEADGDLDLVFATQTGVRLFVNRGNRTFFELPQGALDIDSDDPVSSMAIADLDRDLDLDIITTHSQSGRVGMIENLLHLQFRGRMFGEIDPIEGASSIFVEDVDGNVSWDLIVGGAGSTSIVFSQTANANAWTVDRVVTSNQSATSHVVADFDNDAWLDLLAGDGKTATLSSLGPWGFGSPRRIKDMPTLGSAVAADFRGDGLVDVARVQDQQLLVDTNTTDPAGHHVDVRFKGIDDNASGRVNHFAIGSVLELRFGPHYRAKIVTSPSTHFGIDGFDAASSVRAILPNGLTQTIRDPKIDSLVEEEQTLKGSCPYLYAWDGEKFVFQTDCLWAAPLGLQVARGVVAKDRPWEYLKIDGAKIRPRGDRYEFRITEELWEIAYFDKVALTVVDRPADVEVWTNEKVGPGDIATPTIFAFTNHNLRPLKSAIDTFGRQVTSQLKETDRDFVQGFDRRLRQGLCKPHWVDLDFGDLSIAESKAYLVLTGWILPTDTSLNIQIDQNPDLAAIEFPSVWVPDGSQPEGWRKAIPFMGFPGGKTKTIVVDVTDVINREDPRLRVRTSAQIYWDSARLAIQETPAEIRAEELRLLSAEVGFHGFSAPIRPHSTHPETYDYQRSTSTPRWPPLRGTLTKFGDCTEIVRQWDDSMVVISAGDEIRLEFSLPKAELPDGWKRDFVLHSVGWDKDADLNTLSGQSTGPLPYREMTQYPPPVGERELARSRRLEELNRQHLQRYQPFRSFWYRAQPDKEPRFLDATTAVQ